jgi:hypothetical protein
LLESKGKISPAFSNFFSILTKLDKSGVQKHVISTTPVSEFLATKQIAL